MTKSLWKAGRRSQDLRCGMKLTGTGSATSRIKTGQRIRVNGTSGEVTFPQ
jgi:hypothetical protein